MDELALAMRRAKFARQTPKIVNIVQVEDLGMQKMRLENNELSSQNKALQHEVTCLRISQGRLNQELQIARRSLRDLMRIPSAPTSTCPDLKSIVQAVCVEFHVTHEEIFSDSRVREVSVPRQIAMYLAHIISGRSRAAIGRFFSRDHSVVIHAVKKVKHLRETHSHWNDRLTSIENSFKEKLPGAMPSALELGAPAAGPPVVGAI